MVKKNSVFGGKCKYVMAPWMVLFNARGIADVLTGRECTKLRSKAVSFSLDENDIILLCNKVEMVD